MTTLHLKPSMNRSPLRLGLLLIPLALGCFVLSPLAQAQLSPPADGGYANGNTAEGDFTMTAGTAGLDNSAFGFAALNINQGSYNTGIGAGALFLNSGGNFNTATGFAALYSNIGSDNTAIGFEALISNTEGEANTATGSQALFRNTIGGANTAVGFGALFNTTGSRNIALGFHAGDNLGTGGPGDDNIEIGNVGGGFDTGTIRIGDQAVQGACFIAGIFPNVLASLDPVGINSDGQLGLLGPSSARFKTEIKPMDKASEAILALKPVTFRYKKEIDPKGTLRFGLVAEEVAKIDPDLVGRDATGQVYTVHYDQVNAMLLNEFLKEHKAFVKAQHKVEKLEATVETLVTTVKEQALQIQKVSTQLEVSKPAPQTVLNNQ